MGQYICFEDATRNNLGFTCKHLRLPRDDEEHQALRDAYLRITPYPDAPAALNRLRVLDLPHSIRSNVPTHSIRSVVSNAGLEDRFSQLIPEQRRRYILTATTPQQRQQRPRSLMLLVNLAPPFGLGGLAPPLTRLLPIPPPCSLN
ncbi:hypothetical protein R69749_04505 [Paraburkholderia domus]|nr:hypothetical protein R70006_05574 [Paraburkholderia domus]CAE6842115.1 hypothetical protein R69749_04505 [Paraburkholderia domus]